MTMPAANVKELTPGELSERSGAAISALHFYEREGLISSRRTSGNQRRYPRHMLRRVAFIRVSQQVGHSAAGDQGSPGLAATGPGAYQGQLGKAVCGGGGIAWTRGSMKCSGCATISPVASAAAASPCGPARSIIRPTGWGKPARARADCCRGERRLALPKTPRPALQLTRASSPDRRGCRPYRRPDRLAAIAMPASTPAPASSSTDTTISGGMTPSPMMDGITVRLTAKSTTTAAASQRATARGLDPSTPSTLAALRSGIMTPAGPRRIKPRAVPVG